jgi:hypothetical protein
MHRKLLGIINVDLDAAGQLLIIYCAFVKYLKKNGNTMKQCISYLQDFKNSCDSLRKEVLCHIFTEFGITMRAIKVKVKCTLVQALRLCTGRTDHKGSRGVALLFFDHGTRRGEASESRPGRSLPRERPDTHCTGDWLCPKAGLDRCGKSLPHRDSIPRPSSP